MDEMELHGVGLAVDGVLGAAVRVPAPVHVELGELELAGESAARDPGRVVSLGLEEGLGAVTVVLHLDHPRVKLIVEELEGLDLRVLRVHEVDRGLGTACKGNSQIHFEKCVTFGW